MLFSHKYTLKTLDGFELHIGFSNSQMVSGCGFLLTCVTTTLAAAALLV
jgi:hypothetical protein